MPLRCPTTLALLLVSISLSAEERMPNVVVIFIDDMGYHDIGPFGAEGIETPHLDQMARDGRRFTDFVVSSAVCSASRAALLTGCYHRRVGISGALGPGSKNGINENEMTLAELCKQKGYATAIYGKWHLKSRPKGFDFWEVLPDQGHYYHPELLTPNGEIKTQGYVTDVITDKAIFYLDSLRDTSKPFMLMYNHKAPHRQ